MKTLIRSVLTFALLVTLCANSFSQSIQEIIEENYDYIFHGISDPPSSNNKTFKKSGTNYTFNKPINFQRPQSAPKKLFEEFVKAVDPTALSANGFGQVLNREMPKIIRHIKDTRRVLNDDFSYDPFSNSSNSRLSPNRQLEYNGYAKELTKLSNKFQYYLQLQAQDPEGYQHLNKELYQISMEMQRLGALMNSLR